MNKTQALGITVQSINQQRGSLMFDFIIWSRSAFTSSDVDAMAAIPKLYRPPPPQAAANKLQTHLLSLIILWNGRIVFADWK